MKALNHNLKEMMLNIEKVLATIQHISSHSQNQAAMIEEFQASFEHVVHAATELSKHAHL